MPDGDLTWLIGGAQGGGVDTSGGVFARFAVRSGARVFTNIEYHSNIMGEHSYYRVRMSPQDRRSVLDRVNVLVALDLESLTGDPHLEFPYEQSFSGHVSEVLPGRSRRLRHRHQVRPGAGRTRLTSPSSGSPTWSCCARH